MEIFIFIYKLLPLVNWLQIITNSTSKFYYVRINCIFLLVDIYLYINGHWLLAQAKSCIKSSLRIRKLYLKTRIYVAMSYES